VPEDPLAKLLNQVDSLLDAFPPDIRLEVRALVANPSVEAWEAAYAISVNEDRTRLLWQAVVAVDPDCPRVLPPATDGIRDWDGYCPDPFTIVGALRKAMMPAKNECACRACGRPLTDPVSRSFGVGPVCFARAPRNYVPDLVAKINNVEPGKWIRFGPVPSTGTAAAWQTAFRQSGFQTYYQTRYEDCERYGARYWIFVRPRTGGTPWGTNWRERYRS
jgi:hypothetical protein